VRCVKILSGTFLFRYLSKYLIKLMNEVFQALNDPIRRQILRLLRKKDLTAGEIGEKFEITGASISHHLDKLKRAGLVTSVKKGQFVHYSLNTTVLDDIMEYIITLKKK